MTIELITNDEYDFLLKTQQQHPILTYQNTGYDTFDSSLLDENDKEAIKQIEKILSKNVIGFSSFTNFKLDKEGEILIRLQYDYESDDEDPNGSFIGVGYLLLDNLLNGF